MQLLRNRRLALFCFAMLGIPLWVVWENLGMVGLGLLTVIVGAGLLVCMTVIAFHVNW